MKIKNNVFIAGLVILIISCFFAFYTIYLKDPISENSFNGEGNLIVHYIDVGQGDATFIELPNKETILIDAGEKQEGKTVVNYINELGYDTIDYVIGTHPHSDHIGGLKEVVNTFNIENIYMPKVVANSKIYEDLLLAIKNKENTVKKAYVNVNLIESDKLNVSFLSPTKEEYSNLNNYSAVLKITYGNNIFLFMGDAELEVEKEISSLVSCDVLKVGHHGSDTSSSLDFVKNANPKYAIISVGEGNSYGHPVESILKRYEENNTEVYRTDLYGTIKVTSDGNTISISDGNSTSIEKEPAIENVVSNSTSNFSLESFTEVVVPNEKAYIEIKGIPNTTYSIDVYYKSGKSSAKGLEDKVSDENGLVSFEWTVGSQVTSGTYNVIISDGTNEEKYILTVEEK